MKYIKYILLSVLALILFSVPIHAQSGRTMNVGIYGWDAANGNWSRFPLESNGAIPVNIQDQHTDIVDLYMHEHIGSAITLSSNTAIDDTVVNVVAGHGASAGNLICLKESQRFYQGIILSTTATTLTLDTPLDYAFSAGANCSPTSRELAVDGGPVTKVFHIRPPVGVQWDVVRIMFFLEGTSTMDSALFGDISAITNGIVLRKKDDTYHNIFNIKSNGDFASRAYDIAYDDKAPAGKTAVRIRRTFGGQSKNGVVIRLDGDVPDDLQLLVQDDLTGLERFYVIVQGHVVTD